MAEWCNHNIGFMAERNRRRRDRLEAAGEQLQETLCAALVHLGEKVREGDTGAAMTNPFIAERNQRREDRVEAA